MQIRDLLREQIEAGVFAPGTPIPSESELSAMHEVSRLTVRSAIEELEREGLVSSIQGKGVFVLGKRIERDLNFISGFTRRLREDGSRIKTGIVARYTRPAGILYADIFDVPAESEMHVIRRVVQTEQEPVALEQIYVPLSTLPNIPELNVVDFSMYDLYRFYGIEVTHATQRLEIVTLDQNEARLLNIHTKEAVFRFESTTCAGERVLDYTVTYVRNDLCHYYVDFHHN